MEEKTASMEPVTLKDMRESYGLQEAAGYDAPFVTFTWARWQEMQADVLFSFNRFQRAIEQRQPQLAALVILEMQEIAAEMHKEVYAWILEKGLR
jgi:hypothetical protein